MNRKRTDVTAERISVLRKNGLLFREIAIRFGVSPETIYDRLRPAPRSTTRPKHAGSKPIGTELSAASASPRTDPHLTPSSGTTGDDHVR